MKERTRMKMFSFLMAMLLVTGVIMPAVAGFTISPETDEQFEVIDAGPIRDTLPTKDEIEELNTFISPAKKLIDELKSKNYTNNEITRKLEEQGYGWNPETEACWEGIKPSKEELEIIQQT